MALIKSPQEIVLLRESGRRLAVVLAEVVATVRPGVTGLALDAMAERLIREGGDVPAFKNYQPRGASFPFPATLCISVNDAIVHGIPTNLPLKEGDIVGLDIGLAHHGLYSDMAITVPVGEISAEDRKLVASTKAALGAGIAAARGGARLGDIGAAIEAFAHPHGYGIVRELGGHSVGHAQHEEPYIPNYGRVGKGAELKPGMVLALEPMFNHGTEDITLGEDGYTYRTADGRKSAHFEHTILITEGAPEVLTVTK